LNTDVQENRRREQQEAGGNCIMGNFVTYTPYLILLG